jgi:DNA mismatch repair protein MutS
VEADESFGTLQVACDTEQPGVSTSPHFASILFRDGTPALEAVEEPAAFRDLNLGQVVKLAVEKRAEYDLLPFFRTPLETVEEIEYRHEIFRDVDVPAVQTALREFGERMHSVRAYLELVRKQHYKPEKQRWLLDAAVLYIGTIQDLSRALCDQEPGSAGLRFFAAYLVDYISGASFTSLAAAAGAVLEGLGRVTYNLRINGARVTVSQYADEPDYSDQIEELFARFHEGEVESTLVKVGDAGSMDHVEAEIAQLVARLFPGEFGALERFCEDHREFIDTTVASFDREIQFYLAWADFRERVSGEKLVFSYPELSSESKLEVVDDAFDVALAAKLSGEGGEVVCNGYRLAGDERLLVVTGPNQGGKTTFARMFGQLHYLAALGLPVPARNAQLFLVDRIFTHFEREEVVGSLHGKLDDELIRVRDILDASTPRSVVILNEMFSSATLADARSLGRAVLNDVIARGCLGVCVTFIDELSRLGPATISMVAQVGPDDPAKRTHRVLPKPADGRAYAWAIAEKYGLASDQLRRRIS